MAIIPIPTSEIAAAGKAVIRIHLVSVSNIKRSTVPNHQLIYTGNHFLSSTNGILVFKANKDWTRITGVRLSVFTPSLSNITFNLKKNGVNLFAGSELTIPAAAKQIDLTGLNFATSSTDEFRLDLITSLVRVNAPLILELTIE